MLLNSLVSVFLLGYLVEAIPSSLINRAAPVLPLSTKGRDVIDAKGNVFHYASTNWPGKSSATILEIPANYFSFAQVTKKS
jgi:endoglucanase